MTYAYEGCGAYDCFGSCYNANGTSTERKYAPMVISIKTQAQFSSASQCSAVLAMIQNLENDGVTCGLCVLVLLDLDETVALHNPGAATVGTTERRTGTPMKTTVSTT